MDTELTKLIEDARRAYDAMAPAEKENLRLKQAASWVRAEMSWPEVKFKWINGVKVYDSYEDYCAS